MQTSDWNVHSVLYHELGFDDFEVGTPKGANGFPVPYATRPPISLASLDELLMSSYLPVLEYELNKEMILARALGAYNPVEVTPLPKWRRFLVSSVQRVRDTYYHIVHGICPELADWEEHVC